MSLYLFPSRRNLTPGNKVAPDLPSDIFPSDFVVPIPAQLHLVDALTDQVTFMVKSNVREQLWRKLAIVREWELCFFQP